MIVVYNSVLILLWLWKEMSTTFPTLLPCLKASKLLF